MQVMRTLKQVQGQQIVIDLPDNFYAQTVEIIIIPYKQNSFIEEQQEWKKDFLSVFQWDIKEEDIRIPSWKI